MKRKKGAKQMNTSKHSTTTTTTTGASTAEAERLWTVAQAANYLHCSVSWVYRAVEKGEMPHLKLGGLVRFVPRDVRAHAEGLAVAASGGATVVRLASRRGGR